MFGIAMFIVIFNVQSDLLALLQQEPTDKVFVVF